MDVRVFLVACVLVRGGLGEVRGGAGEVRAAACTTTTLRINAACKLVVHHRGPLPDRAPSDGDIEKIKWVVCPCPNFQLRGDCPRFILNLARRYHPETTCAGYRNPPPPGQRVAA